MIIFRYVFYYFVLLPVSGRLVESSESCSSGLPLSPISLPRLGAIEQDFGEIEFLHYELSPRSMELVNNGHTLELKPAPWRPDVAPSIRGGGLPGTFILHNIHIHWGKGLNEGSEHKIETTSYGGEIQLVHFSEKYPNYEEAKEFKDSLAVLSVFIIITDDNHENLLLRPLMTQLNNLREVDSQVNITKPLPFPLKTFLPQPQFRDRFFRYTGSLTTPDCDENVIWTNYKKGVELAIKQWRQLDALNIGGNHRKLQDTKNRTIFENIKRLTISGTAKLMVSYNPLQIIIILLELNTLKV